MKQANETLYKFSESIMKREEEVGGDRRKRNKEGRCNRRKEMKRRGRT